MRSGIFSIDQENHLYQNKLCQIGQFVAICICNWVVLLLVLGCITRFILVSSYTVQHYMISVVFSIILYLACILCTQYSCIIVICTTCFQPQLFSLSNLNFYFYKQILRSHICIQQWLKFSVYQPEHPVQIPCSGFGQTDLFQLHLCQFFIALVHARQY